MKNTISRPPSSNTSAISSRSQLYPQIQRRRIIHNPQRQVQGTGSGSRQSLLRPPGRNARENIERVLHHVDSAAVVTEMLFRKEYNNNNNIVTNGNGLQIAPIPNGIAGIPADRSSPDSSADSRFNSERTVSSSTSGTNGTNGTNPNLTTSKKPSPTLKFINQFYKSFLSDQIRLIAMDRGTKLNLLTKALQQKDKSGLLKKEYDELKVKYDKSVEEKDKEIADLVVKVENLEESVDIKEKKIEMYKHQVNGVTKENQRLKTEIKRLRESQAAAAAAAEKEKEKEVGPPVLSPMVKIPVPTKAPIPAFPKSKSSTPAPVPKAKKNTTKYKSYSLLNSPPPKSNSQSGDEATTSGSEEEELLDIDGEFPAYKPTPSTLKTVSNVNASVTAPKNPQKDNPKPIPKPNVPANSSKSKNTNTTLGTGAGSLALAGTSTKPNASLQPVNPNRKRKISPPVSVSDKGKQSSGSGYGSAGPKHGPKISKPNPISAKPKPSNPSIDEITYSLSRENENVLLPLSTVKLSTFSSSVTKYHQEPFSPREFEKDLTSYYKLDLTSNSKSKIFSPTKGSGNNSGYSLRSRPFDIDNIKVNKVDNTVVTKDPYYISTSLISSKNEDGASSGADERGIICGNIEVPTWRIHPVIALNAGSSSIVSKTLDDEAFLKRHLKSERDEKSRKRLDEQRAREQAYYEHLKISAIKRSLQKQKKEVKRKGIKTGQKTCHDLNRTSIQLNPNPKEIVAIEIVDELPASVFGIPLKHRNSAYFTGALAHAQPLTQHNSESGKQPTGPGDKESVKVDTVNVNSSKSKLPIEQLNKRDEEDSDYSPESDDCDEEEDEEEEGDEEEMDQDDDDDDFEPESSSKNVKRNLRNSPTRHAPPGFFKC